MEKNLQELDEGDEILNNNILNNYYISLIKSNYNYNFFKNLSKLNVKF